jgi:hypothetical protein
MSKIKRYHWNGDESRGGEIVLDSDHEAEVARLRAEVERLSSFVADYVSAYRNGFDGDDHLLNLARSLLGPTVGDQDV